MHLFYLYIYLRIINYKLLRTMVLIPAYMRFINYNLQYIQKFDCIIIVVNIIYYFNRTYINVYNYNKK